MSPRFEPIGPLGSRRFPDCPATAGTCARRLFLMSAVAAPASTQPPPNADHVLRLAGELNVKVFQVAATAQLLAEGASHGREDGGSRQMLNL